MDGVETRWRPPSVLFIPLILCGGFIFFIDVFQLQSFRMPTATISIPQPRFMGFPEDSLKGFLIKTEGCRIPDMEAFDPSIEEYVFDEDLISCNNDTPPLIESNSTHLFLLRNSLAAYGVSDTSALKCCYSMFQRETPTEDESDDRITVNKDCIYFNNSIKVSEEFINVICSYNGSEIYKDFFAFVPIKPEVKNNLKKGQTHSKMNVLVIGVDAVSRLNLHRQMPHTVQILKDINAIEFLGYNKVGDNTFPNLIPVLTGLSENELVVACWPSDSAKFDNCPMLWKNYSSRGYATVFAEDAAWMGIFNYVKRGFTKQPTNYYWGPFNRYSERQIGNEHQMNAYLCVGSRMVYKTLIDYIYRFAKTMHINTIPYFGFFWGASLSHDFLNKPKLGDNDYAKLLNKLRTTGMLNNTVVIFMSDHGIRWGGIRTTYQGRMEERLPFLFISLPEGFREVYSQTYINLRKNTRRLTTPYDLHETLIDLLDPYALTGEVLNGRVRSRKNKRGYSLFEPIPANRTCDSAGIESHWCTCQQSETIDKSNRTVVEAARFTVQHMNKQLKGYADCANLTLAEIYNARFHPSGKHVLVGTNYTQDYTIAFRTTPGDGNFEVTVRQHLSKNSKRYHFTITGTISRINLYGKQSLCITDFHLKLYCYCKS